MFRAEAIINKQNLIHNLNYIKKCVGDNVIIMPVVKADAYGHGVVEICKTLSEPNNSNSGILLPGIDDPMAINNI